MTDRFVYSCRECANAIVGGRGSRRPRDRACPACGVDRQNQWVQEGQIR